jgi:hypothetical protein
VGVTAAAAACAAGVAGAPAARAEPVHGSLGVGAWGEPIHGGWGVWGGAQLWPGGKWGARVDAYGVEGFEALRLEAHVARIIGDARPHLVVAVHAGGGWAFGEDALLVSAGLDGELGLRVGPLALGLDGVVHGAASDDAFVLTFTSTLSLRAAF